MAQRQWTEQQKICIEDHRGTMVVSAAAGSGKTAVLIERIVALCTDEQEPMDLDHLLAVTFTKAAAAEIRARLSQALTEKLSKDPTNHRLLRQQFILPRAKICTIDAFCADLLRQSALSPSFKVMDEQQHWLMKKEAAEKAVQAAYDEGSSAFLALSDMIGNGKNDKALIDALCKVYDFIQSYPFPEEWLRQQRDNYRSAADPAHTPWGALLRQQAQGHLRMARQLIQRACELARTEAKMQEKYVPLLLDYEDRLRQAADTLGDEALTWEQLRHAMGQLKSPTMSAVKGCTDEECRQQVRAIKTLAAETSKKAVELFEPDTELLQKGIAGTTPMVEALCALTEDFDRRFREKKQRLQMLDFSDLGHQCLQLLTERAEDGRLTRSALALEMAEQFTYIMVDEYQDTNQMQDTLFWAISREESNLFLVGDIKQSIYGFRQAMPQIFLNRREACTPYDGEHYPCRVVLGSNFRSRRQVTDTVNAVFSCIMSREAGGMAYDEGEQLVAQALYEDEDNPAYESEMLLVDRPDGSEQTEAQIEGQVIAARIQRMVDERMLITDHGQRRPVTYGDCCILLRAIKTRGNVYAQELRARGIPASVSQGEDFFGYAEIKLALSLLRLIDNPSQEVALLAVMMSPLFGFTPDDTTEIRLCQRGSFYAAVRAAARQKTSIGERCAAFLKKIERYRTLAAVLPADRLLWQLYEELAMLPLMESRGGGSRADNLRRLHDYAHHYELNGFRGLSAFMRYIDRLQQQGIALTGAAEEQAGAVKILTIHRSKGLEYPVVFVAGLGSRFNAKSLAAPVLLHNTMGIGMKWLEDPTLFQYETLPRTAARAAIRRDERTEEMRTLYVAMTRAREKLCMVMTDRYWEKHLAELEAKLTGVQKMPPEAVLESNNMGEWVLAAAMLHPRGGALRHQPMALTPDFPWHIAIVPPTAAVPLSQAAALTPVETAPLPPDWEQRIDYHYPYLALGKVPAKLTASEVAHQTQSRDQVGRSRPAFMSAGGMTPAQRGTALHTFMQYADYTAAAAAPEQEIDRLVRAGSLSEKQANSLPLAKIKRFFASPLYQRMAKASQLWRELPFTAQRPVTAFEYDLSGLPKDGMAEEITVQGIADCAFEENGTLVIVDYKTDHHVSAQQLRDRYRPQVETYAGALSETMGLSAVECWLYAFSLDEAVAVAPQV